MSGVNQRDTYIYVIAAEEIAHVKIGIAIDPDKRLRQLQTGSPFRLHVARLWGPMPRERAVMLEARAHYILAGCRATGEWFHVRVKLAGYTVWLAALSKPEDLPTYQRQCGETIRKEHEG